LARDQAEAANRAKSAFLANMRHEIHNPMSVILGLPHLLRRETRDPPHQEHLAGISSAAGHLLQVINDILDLSKIEAGKLALARIDFSRQALLARCCGLVVGQARDKGQALPIDTAKVLDALCGEPGRPSQALLNLLRHAVKFTARASIQLRAELLGRRSGQGALRTGCSAVDRLQLRFSVLDAGIGFAPAKLGLTFEPFVQTDCHLSRHLSRRFGSTGLDLAIIHCRVALMDAEIAVSSAPGQGNAFGFSVWLDNGAALPGALDLPTPQTAAVAPADVEARLRQSGQHTRWLLVEDNPVNQNVALALLQSLGLTADIADHGLDAVQRVQRVQQQADDLILMDMQMSEMDGPQATRRIPAMPQGGAMPIRAMTANAYSDDRAACPAAGRDDPVAQRGRSDAHVRGAAAQAVVRAARGWGGCGAGASAGPASVKPACGNGRNGRRPAGDCRHRRSAGDPATGWQAQH
jgi:two-component system sensor histidine kinase/response regulator